MTHTTVNVQIGIKQYVTIMETGVVCVLVPEKWDYSGHLPYKKKERYALELKPNTPKWNEVRRIAKLAANK